MDAHVRIDGQLVAHWHSPAGEAARLKAIRMAEDDIGCFPPCAEACCIRVRAFMETEEYRGNVVSSETRRADVAEARLAAANELLDASSLFVFGDYVAYRNWDDAWSVLLVVNRKTNQHRAVLRAITREDAVAEAKRLDVIARGVVPGGGT